MLAAVSLFAVLFGLANCSPIQQRKSCVAPTRFQINNFQTFTASPGPTYTSAISFVFADSTTDVDTECSRTLPPGSGRSPIDPDNFYLCNDTAVQYLWDGSALQVKETWSCDNA